MASVHHTPPLDVLIRVRDRTWRFPLDGSTVIGASEEADLCIDADGIASRHCRIDRTPLGIRLTDLGCRRTCINGEEVSQVRFEPGLLAELAPDVHVALVKPGGGEPAWPSASASKNGVRAAANGRHY